MTKMIASTALLIAIGAGGVAHAGSGYHLSPANSTFTATGSGTVAGPEGSYSCAVTLTGTTGGHVGSITGAAFSGSPGCENVMARGLPWRFGASSKTKIQINHFDLVYPGLGRCGPNEVSGSIQQGTLSIDDHVPSPQGICKVDASLTTSPPLAIVGN